MVANPAVEEMDQKVVMKIRQVMEVCDTDGDGVISYAGMVRIW